MFLKNVHNLSEYDWLLALKVCRDVGIDCAEHQLVTVPAQAFAPVLKPVMDAERLLAILWT